MKRALQHRGFALIDIFSPCVTFNKDNDNPFFKQRVHRLEDENHDTSDRTAAMEKAVEWGDTIYTGLFYQDHGSSALGDREPVLDQGGPLSQRPMGLSDDQAQKIIGRHDVNRARRARARPGSAPGSIIASATCAIPPPSSPPP